MTEQSNAEDERLLHTARPHIPRVVLPKLAALLLLKLLFILLIHVNLALLDTSLGIEGWLILVIILVLLFFIEWYRYVKNADAIAYAFYNHRIQFHGTNRRQHHQRKGEMPYLAYPSVGSLVIERNWLDELFGTATLVINNRVRLRALTNAPFLFNLVMKHKEHLLKKQAQ